MSHIVAPSILTADFGKLNQEIKMINESEADWVHFDVMDGVFVPNISFGLPIVKVVKKVSEKPLDVHLMIVEPERYFEEFKKAGADILSIHYEASRHLHRSVAAIKELGMKASVVLNPHTNVMLLEDILTDLDMVLIMTVNPGYGGQKFIENSYSKIDRLKNLIIKKNANTIIEVDGGVNLENTSKLLNAGANALVVGNTIFSSDDPTVTISKLKSIK